MKGKILASILLFTLTVSILVGCGKKEVDYNLDVDSEAGLKNTESEKISDASLKQFRSEERWTDDWPVTDTAGTKHNIEVDAKVLVPNLESMRVIESQALGGDKEFKKQCLDSFFGIDTEYYYHEEENYTKDELEKWLPDETEMIENASDILTVAEEFESVSHYAGYRDEILYEITLTDSKVSIQPNWDEVAKCGPEQFREYKRVDFYENYLEGEENECKYSLEEAQEIADKYMQEIGLSGMECTLSASATWCGNNTDVYDDDSADEYVCYGYMFDYTTGLDGVSFALFPEPYQFATGYSDSVYGFGGYDRIYGGSIMDEQSGGSVGNGKARIIVTDDGIHSVTIDNAEVIETAGNAEGLLPLDTVKKIMQEEVIARTAKYNIQHYRVYNHLQLMYLKVSDDTEECITAIPVWCLSYRWNETDSKYNHPIFVNAIDGTVVHFADAEWAGIDVTPEQ